MNPRFIKVSTWTRFSRSEKGNTVRSSRSLHFIIKRISARNCFDVAMQIFPMASAVLFFYFELNPSYRISLDYSSLTKNIEINIHKKIK